MVMQPRNQVETAPPTLPCCWCDEPLEFRAPQGIEPFANNLSDARMKAWLHAETGTIYIGRCSCPGQPHRYSHDTFGQLICKTWRDEHAALPRRS